VCVFQGVYVCACTCACIAQCTCAYSAVVCVQRKDLDAPMQKKKSPCWLYGVIRTIRTRSVLRSARVRIAQLQRLAVATSRTCNAAIKPTVACLFLHGSVEVFACVCACNGLFLYVEVLVCLCCVCAPLCARFGTQ